MLATILFSISFLDCFLAHCLLIIFTNLCANKIVNLYACSSVSNWSEFFCCEWLSLEQKKTEPWLTGPLDLSAFCWPAVVLPAASRSAMSMPFSLWALCPLFSFYLCARGQSAKGAYRTSLKMIFRWKPSGCPLALVSDFCRTSAFQARLLNWLIMQLLSLNTGAWISPPWDYW